MSAQGAKVINLRIRKKLAIGDNTMVTFRLLFLSLIRLRKFPRGRVLIGRHCSGTPHIYSNLKTDTVTIGNYCSIGPDVIIIPSMGHIPAKEYERFRLSTFPLAGLKKNGWQEKYGLPDKPHFVKIGNDVWIGARVIILPAVTVGDGAIIGAGAVVTHDVPPYAVVAGAPARILRFRFDKDQIEKLLRIAWWNWSEEKIVENLDFFYGDACEFVKKFEKWPAECTHDGRT